MKNKFTFTDLFAGIGGFRLALESVGGSCLEYSEIDESAIDAYCQNFKDTPANNLGDITKVTTIQDCDLLVGGVPCQSWSQAGKMLGFNDTRGMLWDDTIGLLNTQKPKAFIFENVKGLTDPRNDQEMSYLIKQIQKTGYTVTVLMLNSSDYGVPQDRKRLYLVGFRDSNHMCLFEPPKRQKTKIVLGDILEGLESSLEGVHDVSPEFFSFNDIRNGESTVHLWDLMKITERQEYICQVLLRNRRKKMYGDASGSPLSLSHLQGIDSSIKEQELNELVKLGVFKSVALAYKCIDITDIFDITDSEIDVINIAQEGVLNLEAVKKNPVIKKNKINLTKVLKSLLDKGYIYVTEKGYEFKNSKISTGVNGINRIFMPHAKAFATLVASDTRDFVSTISLGGIVTKKRFIEEVYNKGLYRQLTKQECLAIQGFPRDFLLPDSRAKWMKLVGNSVSVPVIKAIAESILQTGCFDDK